MTARVKALAVVRMGRTILLFAPADRFEWRRVKLQSTSLLAFAVELWRRIQHIDIDADSPLATRSRVHVRVWDHTDCPCTERVLVEL